MKIVSLVGARPQLVKEAMLGATVRQSGAWEHVLVHSGQHYDFQMSDVFFKDLGITKPDYHLNCGSGTHAVMTASVLTAMEHVLLQEKPTALLVYGDTNTTLAGALAAAKLAIPVIHVEAGIRMDARHMPEEINRVLTDRLASLLCCCSGLGAANLAAEGIVDGVAVTGDIMFDIFLHVQPRITPQKLCAQWGVSEGGYVLATFHRDFNVDDPVVLGELLEGLRRLASQTGLTVLFPVHPRTRKNMVAAGLEASPPGVRFLPPLGYLDLMSLVCVAALVVTDSGGLQKEAYYAGKRAVVALPDAGWRELTDCGWNMLCNPSATDLERAGLACLEPKEYPGNFYGAGDTSQAIVEAVVRTLG